MASFSPSTAPPARTRRSRTLLGAATLLGILLAATTAIAPASAHDQLVSSTPAADAALDPAPSEVVLTYSDNILEVGTEVSVKDAAGTEWVAGTPIVSGPTVTVPLTSGMPGGAYTTEWRVVSSDGHPISGTIPFTVTTPAAPGASASESPAATPTDSVTSPPTGAAPADAPSDSGFSGAHVAIIAAAVLALIVIVAAIVFLLTRRRNRDARPGGDDSL